MATAVTSGVVATLLDASRSADRQSTLTPNAIKAILEFTALPLSDAGGVAYDALTQGTGGLNAAGAIGLVQSINPSAPVGTSWLVAGVTPATIIGGVSMPWAQNSVWGTHIVWGGNIVW